MTKLSTKVIVLASIAISTSGCNVNTKPDHPQIRESFSERRVPRDNTLAASGALGGENQEGSFMGVHDSKVGTAYDKNDSPSSSSSSSNSFFGKTFGGSSSGSSTSSSSSSSSSSSNDSFFSRIWKKLFSQNEVVATNFKVAENRHYPAEHIANAPVGQGDSDIQSENFYTTASEILPINTVQKISASELDPIHNESKAIANTKYGYLLANGDIAHSISAKTSLDNVPNTWKNVMSDSNPIHVAEASMHSPVANLEKPLSSEEEISNTLRNSSPSKGNPNAPETPKARVEGSDDIPSIDELRKKSENMEPPKLSDIPPKPEKKPVARTPTPPHADKMKDTKYRDPIKDVDPSKFENKDPRAELEIDNGKHLVRGTLGSIR